MHATSRALTCKQLLGKGQLQYTYQGCPEGSIPTIILTILSVQSEDEKSAIQKLDENM